MEYEDFRKKRKIELNWRARVAEYVELQTSLRRNGKQISPERYCSQECISPSAFRWWRELLKLEDKFTFYRSFAIEYLNRARKSLELIDLYAYRYPELRMPLIRDAIISYAALFCKSNGRVFTKWHLESQKFVPQALTETHNKICDDRDLIFAHCDLGARDPKVSLIGIALKGKGFYWEDYEALLPQFKELIEAVKNRLEGYAQEVNITSIEQAFQDFLNPPPEALIDPGR
jgi:hypothetical protein